MFQCLRRWLTSLFRPRGWWVSDPTHMIPQFWTWHDEDGLREGIRWTRPRDLMDYWSE